MWLPKTVIRPLFLNAGTFQPQTILSAIETKFRGFKAMIERKPIWITAEIFQAANPHPFRITDIVEKAGAKLNTKDYDMYMRSEISGEILCMSLWARHINLLVDKFGSDEKLWAGHLISISQENIDGKNIRSVKVVQ